MGSTSGRSSLVKVTRMLWPYHQNHEPKGSLLFEYFIESTLVCALNKRFIEKGKEGIEKPCKQVHPNKESIAWHQLVQIV